jgi:dihydroneopterin aldolase
MTSDRIELRGLRLSAIVGVLPEERDRAQPIEIDLDIDVDLTAAGESDALDDTVDYGAVCDLIEAVVVGDAPLLLERLADRIATGVLGADRRIDAVEVAVRKLRPPVAQDLATSGVRVRRRSR